MFLVGASYMCLLFVSIVIRSFFLFASLVSHSDVKMAFAVLYLADGKAMKAKSLYEHLNEDHVDEQPRLLSVLL